MGGLTVIVAVAVAALVGVAVGVRLPRRDGKTLSAARLRSVTRLLFVSTQICALVWVFISYGLAIYSTIWLHQVYTMAELSKPAIDALLGVTALKVLGNIFEHNDGVVFGKSEKPASEEDTGGDL